MEAAIHGEAVKANFFSKKSNLLRRIGLPAMQHGSEAHCRPCSSSVSMFCRESSTLRGYGVAAGLLLYLLDVTFRMAQQVQPVKISRVQACKSATLATLEFNTDPHTSIKPVQVCCCLLVQAFTLLLAQHSCNSSSQLVPLH